MILWLDDSPERSALAHQRMSEHDRQHTIWCRTSEEAILTFRDYCQDLTLAYLDDDLGRGGGFGMEVVDYLQRDPKAFSHIRFVVHSWNLPQGRKMTERLEGVGLRASHIPFGT